MDLIGQSGTDFAGCKLDRKSTSETCQFLGVNLISQFSKKQNLVTLTTIEVEYIVAENYCAQILWIKQQLIDFGIKLKNISIKYDNTSAINLIKNLIQHFRSKYIEIKYYFIREYIQNNDGALEYINTEK